MKSIIKLTGIIVILFSFSIQNYSQDYHVRIGFIGNSITIGSGLTNPTVECYPSQLALLLKQKYGDTCIVQNYAVSGRTMYKKGDFPIWNEKSFKTGYNYAPNIVFIMLGTNDSKPYNWDSCGKAEVFYSDYKAMIDTFLYRNPRTLFIVALPPPAFKVNFDIRPEVIRDGVLPVVDSIAKYSKAVVVDFYHSLKDSGYFFTDGIHPTAYGAKILAKIAYKTIDSSRIIEKVKKGYTFATSLQSDVIGDMQVKTTATLSWTTVDATEVFINGIKVEANGSLKISPSATTKYTLLAKGAFNNDSLVFEQKVYTPVLTKIFTSLSSSEIYKGDTITIDLMYYDQKNKRIFDTIFDVNWAITQGHGRFVNEVDNQIDFIADSAEKIIIGITRGDISGTAKFTVKSDITAISNVKIGKGLKVYPNPVSKIAYFNITTKKATTVTIKVYDMNGRLCLNELRSLYNSGNQVIELNTSKLLKGTYVYDIKSMGERYSGEIIKK
jgi:acyl-CoA thioesterase I